ncbi:uncharacterized protein VTP21DRAFT_3807 [Calcarisporiella thermophila]|uniref:uncharacterized protein n=1 Tax=Calcarisporiella thermophila TaxID=911321 RepID=UPI00374257AF
MIDISKGKEEIPIFGSPEILTERNFEYIRSLHVPNINENESFYEGCDCTDGCEINCPCTRGHEDGISLFECHTQCRCKITICRNRVVQHGPRFRLEVLRVGDRKAYGVRAGEYIPKGAFVCEYAGDVVTTMKCRRIWEEREKSLGNYVLCIREIVGDRVLRTNIDAFERGNVARFINHSCNPNLKIYLVRINNPVPRAALFAIRDISVNEELSYRYGEVDSLENPGAKGTHLVKCECGDVECRGWLPYDSFL